MLSTVLDVFRLRQYFDAVARAREIAQGLRDDAGLLRDLRRALVTLPLEGRAGQAARPFPPAQPIRLPGLEGRRVALAVTGGSGALASMVGVARALEEAGIRPSVISLCSGSALFGFPLAAGLPAARVAEFTTALIPGEYIDVDWAVLAGLIPRARGFAGVLKGDGIERAYRRLLGDMRLGDLAIPAYAPVWNIEDNRVEYLGPRTHPELPVARAVRMAVTLPLFFEPVAFEGGYWCDGGIVDIFPVRPLLDIEPACDVTVAVNGFYPPRFAGEDATGWQDRTASILYVASQVRTCQQVELARANLARLESDAEVVMLEPVPYEVVQGVGFYRQFLTTRDWPRFMSDGRRSAREVLAGRYGGAPPGDGRAGPAPAQRARVRPARGGAPRQPAGRAAGTRA